MHAAGRIGLVCLCLSVLALVGCDKTVMLTWTNVTAQARDVELASPAAPRGVVGTVPGDGGKLRHKLTLDEEDLPATVVWSAGDQSGQFTINKNTPDKLWIDIKPGGPGAPRDEKTKVKAERNVEIKNVPVHQDTVVE